MLNYYEVVTQDDLTLSVDMIRIDFRFCSGNYYPTELSYVNYFRDWLDRQLWIEYDKHMTSAWFRYRHLLVIKTSVTTSFSVGLEFNGCDSQSDRCKGFIEFNPNKILHGWSRASKSFEDYGPEYEREEVPHPWEIFDFVYYQICRMSVDMIVKRFDLAVDIPVTRSSVKLHKDRRDYMQYCRSEEDFTEYLGKRSTGNYVKVYNKQMESSLPDPLTRVELTIEFLEYEEFIKTFPVVYVDRKGPMDFSGLKGTDLVLCELMADKEIGEREKYLKKLGRVKAEKLKPYLLSGNGCEVLQITEDTYYVILEIVKRYHKPMMAKLAK